MIGTADFVSADELLAEGQRRLFTTRETANVTGQLQAGRKLAVKALLIRAEDEDRLNVLTVQSIADTCQ
jgi:hypothetical protein